MKSLKCNFYLDETNVGRVLTEALTTHVQIVLSDEGGLMSTDSALARAFSVFLGVGVPDRGVGHFSYFFLKKEELRQ